MKRILLYVLILALVLLIPVESADVADLRPIEVICIYKEGNTVILETDTGDVGSGTNAIEALADMKQTSPAVIYLDTAEYLLVSENAAGEVDSLREILKDSVKLCMTKDKVALEDAAKYLPVHGDLPQIREWKTGDRLPILSLENGRIKLSEKSEN